MMLDMALKDIERVLYFEHYIVTEPGLTSLKQHQLLTEDDYLRFQEEFGDDSFTAEIGAEAVRGMLQAHRPRQGSRQAARRAGRPPPRR